MIDTDRVFEWVMLFILFGIGLVLTGIGLQLIRMSYA